MQHLRQPAVAQKNWNEHKAGKKDPPARNEYVILLQTAEDAAPTRNGFSDAEAQEGERDLGQNVLGNQKRSLREQHAQCLRQDVAPQKIEIGRAEASTSEDISALSCAQTPLPGLISQAWPSLQGRLQK